jgi:hypothetical protein
MADSIFRAGTNDCDERGERGERGKRGKRGHRGHDGDVGATGPTGPAAPVPDPCCDPFEFIQNLRLDRLEQANSGDMLVELLGPNPETIFAADLNAAPTGTFTRMISTQLVNSEGALHDWANFAPNLIPTENVADPSVLPPSIVGSPKFTGGLLTVQIVFDTDAGATKTYAPGDTLSLSIGVSATDTLLGYPISPMIRTYTVA